MQTQNDRLFFEIYSEHYEAVLSYLTSRLGSLESAQDLTQDVFERIKNNISSYDPEKAKINTWVYTIANRMLIDLVRKDKSKVTVNVSDYTDDNDRESFQFIGESSTDGDVENDELKSKLVQCFDSLKPKYKKVAELYLIDGRPYEEIAELLNVPIGTVKGTLNRAKRMLQGMLQGEYAML